MEEIFDKTKELNNKIMEDEQEICNLNEELSNLTHICPHEIVFKYNDNHPHKMVIDGNYFCPACGKIIMCTNSDELANTDFKNSRVIPLTNISLRGTKETLSLIRNEVYDNLDLYYDRHVRLDYLIKKMEDTLKDQVYDYYQDIPFIKVLKRKWPKCK